MSAHSHLWPGVPLALGSAVLFGLSAPLSKLLLGAVDPWLLAGILYLGAGLGLAGWTLARPSGAAREAALRRADLPWLVCVVVVGGMAGPLLLMLGLSLTSAASASLLLNVEGVATMAIAWIVFGENVDRRLLVGAALIVAGAVALSWTGAGLALDPGGLLVIGACLCWGIDNNLTRKLSSADPVAIAIVKGLCAGACNIGLALALGAVWPGLEVAAAGAVIGFFAVGVSLVLFILALRHLGAARTGAYFSLAPFIGAAAALPLIGEAPSPQLALAGLLMGAGLWLHLSERHDHPHVHEPLEHDHLHVHDAHHQHEHGRDDPPGEPHAHPHRHQPLSHTHPHYPDLHHAHRHG